MSDKASTWPSQNLRKIQNCLEKEDFENKTKFKNTEIQYLTSINIL